MKTTTRGRDLQRGVPAEGRARYPTAMCQTNKLSLRATGAGGSQTTRTNMSPRSLERLELMQMREQWL